MKLEYALLVALIASVAVIGLTHTATVMQSPYKVLSEKLSLGSGEACGAEGSEQGAVSGK